MNTSTPPSGGVDTQPFGDGTTTRVRFRGWIIDVDAAGNLTLPRQGLANVDLDDLSACMAAALSGVRYWCVLLFPIRGRA